MACWQQTGALPAAGSVAVEIPEGRVAAVADAITQACSLEDKCVVLGADATMAQVSRASEMARAPPIVCNPRFYVSLAG
jgi:hypothetical protein